MAIEKKIPSPSEIIGEAKKFTPEEVQELQTLQTQISQLTLSFGQLSLSKIKLEEQESFLKSQLKMLEEKETNLAKTLSGKYGKGSLNTETGEFTPVK